MAQEYILLPADGWSSSIMSDFLERRPLLDVVRRGGGAVRAAASALNSVGYRHGTVGYQILRSIGENGPKLARMDPHLARVLSEHDPTLVVEPNRRVVAALRQPLRVVRTASWKVPTTQRRMVGDTSLSVKVLVRDESGQPVRGARVLALDAARDEGLAHRTNSAGIARFQLPAVRGVLPRLVVEPIGNCHGWTGNDIVVAATGRIEVMLRRVDPATASDGLRRWAARLPRDAGLNVRIAVVDTGVDPRHPDLAHVATAATEGLIDATEPGEPHPHATHVAGIIGARGSVFRGVAPEAGISSMRVTPWGSLETGAFDLGAGIEAAAAAGDVHLINVSMAADGPSSFLVRAAAEAFRKGAICIAAAGNDGRNGIAFPAANKWVMAVSAYADGSVLAADAVERNDIGNVVSKVDANLSVARFSNYGPDLDFMAPGVGIISCLPEASYASASGTSFAAPAVTGMAAAVLARDHADLLNLPPGPLRAIALMRALLSCGADLGFHAVYQGLGMLDA